MTYFPFLCFNDVMCAEGGENLCFFDCLSSVYFSHLKLYSPLHTNIFHWTRNVIFKFTLNLISIIRYTLKIQKHMLLIK